jgi:hypothetical protein
VLTHTWFSGGKIREEDNDEEVVKQVVKRRFEGRG